MFAAAMAGGRFTYPRLVSSPTTYDQTGSTVVQFSPAFGTTLLTINVNAEGGDYNSNTYFGGGGGQGAYATGLAVSCADTDLFELTFTSESLRGRRIALTQNGSTVFDLRGGFDGVASALSIFDTYGGDGGEALTPSVTAGVGGAYNTDPTNGSSTSYLSGTVYSGDGGFNAQNNTSAAWIAYQGAEFPNNGGGADPTIVQGPGGGSSETGGDPGWGATEALDYNCSPSPCGVRFAPDIARCVITW